MQDLTVARADKHGENPKLDQMYNIPSKYFKPNHLKHNDHLSSENKKPSSSLQNNHHQQTNNPPKNWEDNNSYNVQEQLRLFQHFERERRADIQASLDNESYEEMPQEEEKEEKKEDSRFQHKFNNSQPIAEDQFIQLSSIDANEQNKILESIQGSNKIKKNNNQKQQPKKNWSHVVRTNKKPPHSNPQHSNAIPHHEHVPLSTHSNTQSSQFKMSDMLKQKARPPNKYIQPFAQPSDDKPHPSKNKNKNKKKKKDNKDNNANNNSNDNNNNTGKKTGEINIEWIQQLTNMGFDSDSVLDAIIKTNCVGIHEALDYLATHSIQ